MSGLGVSDAKTVFDIVERMWGKVKALDIIGQGLILKVPENTVEYNATIDVHRHRPFARKITFPADDVLGFRMHSLPTLKSESQAMSKSSKGLEIDFGKLSENADLILLSFECRLPRTRFLENLVQRNVERETSSIEAREYWLHAQLKQDLNALKTKYGVLDIRNLDLLVNVGVEQEIKNSIPSSFQRELRIIRDWIRATDREAKGRLSREHLAILRKRHTRAHEILASLQQLFLPKNFEAFVDVIEPFYYSECSRGASYFDIPFYYVPSSMCVISRTNLSLDRPAADGKLIYKRSEFQKEIFEIFGSNKD